jgi:hypothetical protein
MNKEKLEHDDQHIGDMENTEQTKKIFDDPVQRTRFLVAYIKSRKQRAQAEIEQRKALTQKKLNAQAKLQNAHEALRTCESDIHRVQQKSESLGRERHELVTALKAIHSKENERKKQREAEAQRMMEEQKNLMDLIQRKAEQDQQAQSLAASRIAALTAGTSSNVPLLNTSTMPFHSLSQLPTVPAGPSLTLGRPAPYPQSTPRVQSQQQRGGTPIRTSNAVSPAISMAQQSLQNANVMGSQQPVTAVPSGFPFSNQLSASFPTDIRTLLNSLSTYDLVAAATRELQQRNN